MTRTIAILSLSAALAISGAILLWGKRGHDGPMQQFYGRSR